MLAYPDPDVPFIVDEDASNLAIGAVLSQLQNGVGKVIMYGSKSFSRSQRLWCTIRRKHVGIIHTVTVKFSIYWLGPRFYIEDQPFIAKIFRLIPL